MPATDAGVSVNEKEPRSLSISARGVKTGADFANLMSALMSDLIRGTGDPANRQCHL